MQYFVRSVFLSCNEFSNRILFSRRPLHSISLEHNNGSCCDYALAWKRAINNFIAFNSPPTYASPLCCGSKVIRRKK